MFYTSCSFTPHQERLEPVTLEEKIEARNRLEKARKEFYSLLTSKVKTRSIESGESHETYITNESITNIEVTITNQVSGEIITTNLIITNFSVSTNTYEMSPMDVLYAKGMLEINAGETNAVDNYLKDIGLYDEAMEIKEKYELDKAMKTLYSPTGTKNQTDDFYTNFLKTGDILLSIGPSSQGTSIAAPFIPGTWKHAGLMDKREYNKNRIWFIFTASNKTRESQEVVREYYILWWKIQEKRGACVGWESIKQWKDEWCVSAYRVKGYSETKGQNALDYVKQFIRKKFAFLVPVSKWVDARWEWRYVEFRLFGWWGPLVGTWCWVWVPGHYEITTKPFTKENNEYWYCTKVAYRAWKSQNINIEYSGGRWDPWVSPDDIRDSLKDGTIEHIGGNDPWNP